MLYISVYNYYGYEGSYEVIIGVYDACFLAQISFLEYVEENIEDFNAWKEDKEFIGFNNIDDDGIGETLRIHETVINSGILNEKKRINSNEEI